MKITGSMMIDLMGSCLSEMSETLRELRGEADAASPQEFAISKNAVLFSIDMNLAAMHMLGARLAEVMESEGPEHSIELSDSERVIVGMSGSFMNEMIADLIEKALQGEPVSDDEVRRALESDDPEMPEDASVH